MGTGDNGANGPKPEVKFQARRPYLPPVPKLEPGDQAIERMPDGETLRIAEMGPLDVEPKVYYLNIGAVMVVIADLMSAQGQQLNKGGRQRWGMYLAAVEEEKRRKGNDGIIAP